MRAFAFAVVLLVATNPALAQLHRLVPHTAEELQELFRHTEGEALPFVSAHRGGPQKGFPENCVETFEHTLRHTFATLEVDPRYTKDGAIVLHHDPSVERTSNGHGAVSSLTLAELKQLKLKDTAGNLTAFTIPTLDEALEWARGKTILVLDQKDVPVAARVKKMEEHHAEGYALMIVNSFKDAQACHTANPHVMMEVMIPNRGKAVEFDSLGIPWKNVVAFVGHVPPEDRGLYDYIHGKGANCMIGTSRNLDKRVLSGEVSDIKQLEPDYRAFMKRGADLIETDIPVLLGPLLNEAVSAPKDKARFFVSEK